MSKNRSAQKNDGKAKLEKLTLARETIKDLAVSAGGANQVKGGVSARGCITSVNQRSV